MSMNTNPRSKFGRIAKLACVPLLLVTLAACATPFKADVSRFQSQLPAPAGQGFAIMADDPALAGGIEFSQYANIVEAQMVRLGYTPAAPDSAALLVRFDYGVDKGRERVSSTGVSDPFYSPWYGYGRHGFYSPYRHSRIGYLRGRTWGYGFYDPFFDRAGADSYTIYTSAIDMKIDGADGERLFEGKAQAISTSNQLQYLVPNLIEAMFTDFPGNSGETVRISIAPEKKTVRQID